MLLDPELVPSWQTPPEHHQADSEVLCDCTSLCLSACLPASWVPACLVSHVEKEKKSLRRRRMVALDKPKRRLGPLKEGGGWVSHVPACLSA